jgi:hypothetical protein
MEDAEEGIQLPHEDGMPRRQSGIRPWINNHTLPGSHPFAVPRRWKVQKLTGWEQSIQEYQYRPWFLGKRLYKTTRYTRSKNSHEKITRSHPSRCQLGQCCAAGCEPLPPGSPRCTLGGP